MTKTKAPTEYVRTATVIPFPGPLRNETKTQRRDREIIQAFNDGLLVGVQMAADAAALGAKHSGARHE